MENTDIDYMTLIDYAMESSNIERVFKCVFFNYSGRAPLQVCIDEVAKDIADDVITIVCRLSCDRYNDEEAKREIKYKELEDFIVFDIQRRIDYLHECYESQKGGNG